MKQLAHLLAKDIRFLRLPLALWLLAVAAQAALAGSGVAARHDDLALAMVFEVLTSLVPLVRMVLVCILVPLLVHADSLVGTEAFWLTRPISRRTLLAEKALFVGAFLIVPPLAAELSAMAANGVTTRDLALAVPEIALEHLALVAVVLALAVLTPGFARFAVVGGATFALLLFASFAIFSIFMLAEDPNESHFVNAFADPSAGIVAAIATVVFGAVVVVHQYLTRRTRRSVAFALAGIILVELAAFFWPWSLLGEWGMPPLSIDPTPVTLSIDPRKTWISDDPSFRGGRTAKKKVAARLEVLGLAPDYVATVEQVRSRLTFRDGVTVDSRGGAEVVRREVDSSTPATLRAFENIVAPARLVASESLNYWPELVRIDDGLFGRYRKEEGVWSAEFDLRLMLPTVVAEMPLQKGSRYDSESFHAVVVDVLRRSDGCVVILRESRPILYSAAKGYTDAHYILRNRGRAEAVLGTWMSGGFRGSIMGPVFWNFSLNTQPRLDIRYLQLRFPGEGEPAPNAPTIDEAWLAGATLLRVESKPAGRLTKQVRVDRFVLDPR
jgi:hypothetical protein